MTSAPTGALLDTCFRQIEYAGVLADAKNPAAAAEGGRFLAVRGNSRPRSRRRCTSIRSIPDTPLPADWQKYAPVAPHPADP